VASPPWLWPQASTSKVVHLSFAKFRFGKLSLATSSLKRG
jgi:hypothetical protein